MIIPDKKKSAMVILDKLGGGGMGTPAVPEMQMGDGDQVLHSISQELLMGFEKKSASDVMKALKAFFAELSYQDEQGDSEESEE